MIYVGDTFTDTWTVVNNQNAPVTGLGWVAEVSQRPDNTPVPYLISELGSGAYRIQWVCDRVGHYFVQLRSSSNVDGQPVRFGIEADCDGFTDLSTPLALQDTGGTSLGELIDMMAGRFRDIVEVQATQDGSTNTLTDELNFVEADNHFRGSEIVFVGGTPSNVGSTRRIISSSITSQTVSIVPALAADTKVGDTARIYNLKERGFRKVDYRRGVNFAIKAGAPATDLLISQTISEPFFYGSSRIAIPDVFDSVAQVQYAGYDGKFVELLPLNSGLGNGWQVDIARRQIEIGYPLNQHVDGRAVRITGYTAHPTMFSDTETTRVDFEWIVSLGCYYLLGSKRKAEDFGLTGQLRTEAEMVRAKIAMSPRLPNNVRLR